MENKIETRIEIIDKDDLDDRYSAISILSQQRRMLKHTLEFLEDMIDADDIPEHWKTRCDALLTEFA
jgi:hypothetical protein